MATVLKWNILPEGEDLQSRKKIVNLFVLKKPEEPGMSQEHELASFEALMLPHLDAAHNLARWFCVTKTMRRILCRKPICVPSSLSTGSMAPTGAPGS